MGMLDTMKEVDQRQPLTDFGLKQRFLATKALANFLQNVTEAIFDDAKAREEVEERNRLRQSAHLPRLNVDDEVRHMKAAFEQAVKDSEFPALAANIIHEVHGDFERGDFDGISSMAPFFARRHNIVRVILAEKNVRLYWLSARQRRL